MDVAERCKIIRQTLFETGHGFAVAQAKDSNGFVVWQFTQTPFGRDFYHGRYFALRDDAERDFRRRTDNYKSINKTDRQSLQSPARYCRYYSTQRPVDIGTYPKPDGNAPLVIVNYDCDRRRPVAGGLLCAWGELVYREPLAEGQARDYELAPAPEKPCPAPNAWKIPGTSTTMTGGGVSCENPQTRNLSKRMEVWKGSGHG